MLNKKEVLKEKILPLIEKEKLELVELELIGKPPRSILRVFVDKVGGVNLDECASLSEKLSEYLDTEDLIEGSYILEVSSPGLERPLLDKNDFRRKKGERVKVYQKTLSGETTEITGQVIEVGEEALSLKVENRIEVISWSRIEKGKIFI